ncbi:uncharacterized protein [Maniola hyperantus]|uniref:uncharacterized protein isoform X2 n=1 Tax=Aphantopus hyperantus TaxID=2795564 RepID=UPI003748827A
MKCQKVPKNPCKICLQKVTKKNGLQCKGVCRTWVHFKCLNYSPGKIQDIKAGVIKVMCPCPNCETNDAKEILTNPPLSCTNSGCPVNLPPPCESVEYASKANPYSMYGSDTSCKSSQSPNLKSPSPKYKRFPVEYSPDKRHDVEKSMQSVPTNQTTKTDECSCSPLIAANQSRQGVEESTNDVPTNQSTKIDECPCSRTTSVNQLRQGVEESAQAVPTNQSAKIDECSCSRIAATQSQSYSDVWKSSDYASKQQKMRPSSSDSKVPCTVCEENQKMLYSTIQSLCNTVGNLSKQLRDLMYKLEKCTQ